MKDRTDSMRRRVLAAGAAGLALAFAAPAALGETIRHRLSLSRRTFPITPDPEDAELMIHRALRDREPSPGLVHMDVTDTAENGSSVPLVFDVDCSMAGNDFPETVHVFVVHNPFPEVARYHYGPWNGSAETEMRLRMRQSSEIVVVAEMADGRVGIGRRQVNVLAGACG